MAILDEIHPAEAPVGSLTTADGRRYIGRLHAARPPAHPLAAEVVFTTAMGGYPEAISDPSYQGQILVLAYPEAGVYGVPADAVQSREPMIHGLVVRDLAPTPPGVEALDAYLGRHGIPILSGIDTRALIRRLRTEGTSLGTIVAGADGLRPDGAGAVRPDPLRAADKARPAVPGTDARPIRVTVVDLGAKRAVLAMLVRHADLEVRTLPIDAGAEAIAQDSDVVLFSNGPGDPADMTALLPTVRAVAQRQPTFGICLGHQLLAEAFGAKTYKLRYGHRGVNHPVRDLHHGATWISSHNHGYAVADEGLPEELEVTVRDLTDGTVEGLRHRHLPVVTLQFHPEGAPGPQEADAALDRFLDMVRQRREGVRP